MGKGFEVMSLDLRCLSRCHYPLATLDAYENNFIKYFHCFFSGRSDSPRPYRSIVRAYSDKAENNFISWHRSLSHMRTKNARMHTHT